MYRNIRFFDPGWGFLLLWMIPMEYDVTVKVKELTGYTFFVFGKTEEEAKKKARYLYEHGFLSHEQRLSSSIEDIEVKKVDD